MDITIGSSLWIMIDTPALLFLSYCPKEDLCGADLSSFNSVTNSHPTECQKPAARKASENFILAPGLGQYLQGPTVCNMFKEMWSDDHTLVFLHIHGDSAS